MLHRWSVISLYPLLPLPVMLVPLLTMTVFPLTCSSPPLHHRSPLSSGLTGHLISPFQSDLPRSPSFITSLCFFLSLSLLLHCAHSPDCCSPLSAKPYRTSFYTLLTDLGMEWLYLHCLHLQASSVTITFCQTLPVTHSAVIFPLIMLRFTFSGWKHRSRSPLFAP